MNLALFDFDGTITFTDTYTPFVHRAVPPRRLAAGKVVLSPVMVAYKVGAISPSAARIAVARFGFRGLPESDVRQTGLTYARDVLPGTIRPIALERIHWHKDHGDVVVVVSAGLHVYLAEWCRRIELDLICTELEAKDGTLTGRYCEGDCIGTEKARRVLEKYDLGDYAEIYAYGDTLDDFEMLSLATRKFFKWQEISDVAVLKGKDRRQYLHHPSV